MIELHEIPLGEIDLFWREHLKYLVEDGIVTDPEDLAYFSGEEYRGVIWEHMRREPDRHHLVWFCEEKVRVGAASYCIYQSEDGKCFILDFWVFPGHRGGGMGHRCFEALERYTRATGAAYYQLNSEKEASVRFWKSLGFVDDGRDEYDMPLFVKR